MYISLVRLNLEYASQVWNPYKVGEVNSSEHVQKFALRMCAKSWDSSYQELLQLFSLPDLQQCGLYLDLCIMFRIINGLFYFPNDVFVHQTSSIITRSSTSQTLICPFARTCSYFNSFLPHTIRSWNFLPTTVTSINSIASFKLKHNHSHLNNIWSQHVRISDFLL